jgi:DNA-binding transcriptional regulator YhcF (GntR family)
MTRRIIYFDPDSPAPKYRQIIQSIKRVIEKKTLRKGDKIPSINQVCSEFNLSRDTVMQAYNELKSHGIIVSKKGKGYFIERTDTHLEEKIFLLFDELNTFKEDLYNSFMEGLDSRASVDVFFHHFNYQVFKNQLSESIGKYSSYVIMPAGFDNFGHLLQKLPRDRVFILDRSKPDLNSYPVIYQDFELDVYEGLVNARNLLEKYRRLIFIQPVGKEPQERVQGFRKFCQEFKFDSKVVRSLSEIRPLLYDAFLVPSDRTLVELIKTVKEYEFEIGSDFGIISFNDSILKQVVAGGITTISTDFQQMGKLLSEMVLQRTIIQTRNKSGIIIRKSL